MEYSDPEKFELIQQINSLQRRLNAKTEEVAKTEDFTIIRVGYRGYRNPRLVLDSQFTNNIQGALNSGMEVGAYFFTTAITVAEAIEEANWTIDRLEGYNVTYPVAVDVEWTNGDHDGRSDYLSKEDRTVIVKAFCETIKSRGYTPMIYASKYWLNKQLGNMCYRNFNNLKTNNTISIIIY